MYTKYYLIYVIFVVVTQGPTSSFGKREMTDESEYSNVRATYIVYAGPCPRIQRCVALKLSNSVLQ